MRLYIARRPTRVALSLPMEQTGANPNLLFLLKKTDRGQLDELVRSELEKQGVTSEPEVQKIVDEAEAGYEDRVKAGEASREVRRLMDLKRDGWSLVQRGYRKWKPVKYNK